MRQTKTYHEIVQKLRDFFLSKNFVEVPTQSRKSILAACENPYSVATFTYDGEIWPLPQTGQMWLEYEMLKNPEWEGCFCISTSYRDEKNLSLEDMRRYSQCLNLSQRVRWEI